MSPQQFGAPRFVTDTSCRAFRLVVDFPTPAACYDPAVKTFFARAGIHRVPPTPEIIAFSKNAVFFEGSVFERLSFHSLARGKRTYFAPSELNRQSGKLLEVLKTPETNLLDFMFFNF